MDAESSLDSGGANGARRLLSAVQPACRRAVCAVWCVNMRTLMTTALQQQRALVVRRSYWLQHVAGCIAWHAACLVPAQCSNASAGPALRRTVLRTLTRTIANYNCKLYLGG